MPRRAAAPRRRPARSRRGRPGAAWSDPRARRRSAGLRSMPWDGSQRGDVLGGRPGPCRCRSPRCRCGAYILVHRPSTRETQSHDTSSVPFAGAPSTSLLPGGLHFDVGHAGRPRGCSVAGRPWTQNRPWMYWQVARGPGLPTGYSILAPGPHECASPCAPPWRSDMTTRVSGSEKKCLACSAGAVALDARPCRSARSTRTRLRRGGGGSPT